MSIELNTAGVSAERATTQLGETVQTLVELLDRRAAENLEDAGYTFLLDGEQAEQRLGYRELQARARALAAALQGGEPGERVLVLLPPGLDFIVAFFACLYAGLVAVPLPLPQGKRGLARVLSVIADCKPRFALTSREVLDKSELERGFSSLKWIAIDGAPSGGEDGVQSGRWQGPTLAGTSPAFLQYTSGSTAAPKGVVLSHENLLQNERMIADAFAHDAGSVVVGWLPPHHDMGLIGNILQPLYLGVPCVQMAPQHFLLRPLRWLAAIARYRGTTSGGPNFAYDLCVKKTTPAERAALDLSCWRVAFNGAEPVRAATLDRFAEAFAAAGFERSSFYPCYGLAEATLFVTGGAAGRMPVVSHVDPAALERGRARCAAPDDGRTLPLVGCGHPRAGASIEIVQPVTGERCAAGEVGEIWISGATVAAGYWQRGQENSELFGARMSDGSGPYLRSGDLGFVQDGELYVTGRLKDLIIIRGRNVYPQDLELCAERSHASLREGGACAFSLEVDGEEQVVLVQEVSEGASEPERLAQALRKAVAERHEVSLHEVVFIRQGTLPRTTSGKLQRRACRAQLLAGELALVWRSRAELTASTPAPSDGPQGDLETRLGSIWCEVLACPWIGRHDQFLSLGGDSLKAMQVSARVREALGYELEPTLLFDSATVASLAVELERQPGVRARDESCDLSASFEARGQVVASSDDEASPLSPIQERLWFLEQLTGGAPVYHIAVAAHLRGTLDPVALRQAIADVTQRHAVLRARFVADGDQVQQRFDGPSQPELVLRAVRPGADAEELAGVLRDEAGRRFEVLDVPPLRWTLFSVDAHRHVLTLVCHHLLLDGWSVNLVQRELWLAYRARAAGRAPLLPALGLEYTDYVRAERSAEREKQRSADLDYWKRQVAGSGAPLELPSDRPRGAVQSYAGARAELWLDAALRGELERLARREGVTFFTVLATGFLAFLYRITGQSDLCLGMPVAGRSQPRLQALAGCCLNTLPLRVAVDGQKPLSRLLGSVAQRVREALAHQAAPFERILSSLPLERDLSRPPLFQVMLSLQPELGALAAGPELAIELRQLDTGAAQFDLALDVALDGDGARIAWEYAVELFDRQTIEGFGTQLRRVFEALARQPALRVCEVDLAAAEGPASGGAQSLVDSAAAAPDVLELVLAGMNRDPAAVALRAAGATLSYAELERASERVARRLQALGCGREQRVATYLPSSPELVVCVLGVLRAGAAYVPLDPQQPRASLLQLLAESGAACLVTDAATAAELRDVARPVVSAEALMAPSPAGEPAPLPAALPEQLAYVIYTSGSTGRPKGVQITRRSLASACAAWQATHHAAPGELRMLSTANPAFDVWTADWVRALSSGGTLLFAQPEQTLDPVALTALMDAERVSVVDLVPALLAPLLDVWESAAGAPRSLRWCIVGSEAWSLGDYRRLRRLLPESAQLSSCYGVTEATIDSAYFEEPSVAPASADVVRADHALVPLGAPFPGTELCVLDRDGRPVPTGAVGELFIGGEGVARGYVDNPRLTAERFVPSAVGKTPGARLYRTGDRARLQRDGVLEFLGRVDHQLKIRGRRVEPGEVEQQLAAHPAVKKCVVVLHARRSLVAYVVPHGARVPVGELRVFLRERLAEALVPQSFVWLDVLPLNPNGKLDRKALPDPVQAEAASAPPSSDLERQIASIWQEVLGVPSVGVRDNFFDLGGHSLLLARVLAALRQGVAPEATMLTLFRHPTVQDLAAALSHPGPGGSHEQARRDRERTAGATPRRAELLARRRKIEESGK